MGRNRGESVLRVRDAHDEAEFTGKVARALVDHSGKEEKLFERKSGNVEKNHG